MGTERDAHNASTTRTEPKVAPEELTRRRLIVGDIIEIRGTIPRIRGLTVEELLDRERVEVDE